ncbi:LysR family transcriptional regulator [Pseudomonas sp. AS2.8]|uniref:LysR family transcriptional regulator n=1 Tax=Pseudomonas sp. AS2.8 TaxID=2587128 RepID=UPI001612A392|nr:LysR family transcriptional regulator [Pseudomonas sp. AS2.8]MBB2896149.1 DNA-binding transcriptional LysR family regulator [Pseudomonas sp. AS2.8]
MAGFDLEQLRTLVTAVDAGSLSAAVPLRCLSQSALSEQLRKLEERAGHTLLTRSKTGVRPTAAGERLLAHARPLLAMADAAWRDLHQIPLEGEACLGVTDYFRPADLARLLARLHQQLPGLRLRTRIGRSDELEMAQRQGELDLAIVMSLEAERKTAPRVKISPLHQEPLIWVGALDADTLQRGRPLSLALLPEGCSLHRLACSRLQAAGIPYVVSHIASGVAGLQAALTAGLGIACLNASAVAGQGLRMLDQDALPALPSARFLLLHSRYEDQSVQSRRLQGLSETIASSLRG